jgi:hypothetical protein
LIAVCGNAEAQNKPAPHILPTADQKQPATPTVQPPRQGVLSLDTNAPAAPSTQPIVPKQPGMNEGLGSIQTQIEALPVPGLPDIKSPNPVTSAEKALEERQPYVPPELREKITPDSNMMLPPLYGWTRIVLHDLVMPRKQSLVDSCGMKKDFIFQFFAQRLQEGGIPVMSEDQAKRLVPEPIKVEATPIIVSMEDLVINCTSWVQFQITAEMTMRVPPMMYRRKMPLLLWHDGMLVTSAKSTHNGALINAFIELAMRFRNSWEAQQGMVNADSLVK